MMAQIESMQIKANCVLRPAPDEYAYAYLLLPGTGYGLGLAELNQEGSMQIAALDGSTSRDTQMTGNGLFYLDAKENLANLSELTKTHDVPGHCAQWAELLNRHLGVAINRHRQSVPFYSPPDTRIPTDEIEIPPRPPGYFASVRPRLLMRRRAWRRKADERLAVHLKEQDQPEPKKAGSLGSETALTNQQDWLPKLKEQIPAMGWHDDVEIRIGYDPKANSLLVAIGGLGRRLPIGLTASVDVGRVRFTQEILPEANYRSYFASTFLAIAELAFRIRLFDDIRIVAPGPDGYQDKLDLLAGDRELTLIDLMQAWPADPKSIGGYFNWSG